MGDGNTTPVSGGATGYTISCNAPTALVNLVDSGWRSCWTKCPYDCEPYREWHSLDEKWHNQSYHSKTITYGAGGTLKYDGTTALTTTPSEWPTAGGPTNVTMSNAAGITLDGPKTIPGALTLTSGVISTGANTLAIGAAGSVSRTSGHIAGNLQKNVGLGAPSLTFEIGDATTYRPINLAFSSVTTAGDVAATVSQAAGDHPAIATSGLNGSKSVNRYWTLTNVNTLAFTDYSSTFNFVAGDVDAGANTNTFLVGKYDSPNWTLPTAGTRTATSTQATGITGMSDFAVAEAAPIVITTFPYAEGFENTTFPPTNWTSAILSGSYNWDRVTSGSNPTQLPYGGVGEARFQSYNAAAPANARLMTPLLQVPPLGLQVLFQMYHDNGYSSNADSITVDVSTDGGTTWAGVAKFLRYNATNAWQSHIVNLTGYTGVINVGFHAWSRYGNNMFIDSVDIRETPLIPPDPAGIVSPLNAATNVLPTATLNWSTPGGGGGLTGYKLYFGTDGGGVTPPTNIVNGTNLGVVLTYDPTPDMAFSTTYYWQIVPTGPGGDATGCPIWSFTIGADPTITAFPYAEGFESLTFPPYGWTNTGTTLWTRSTGNAYAGAADAHIVYSHTGNSILTSPPINLPANQRITWWWKDADASLAAPVKGPKGTFDVPGKGPKLTLEKGRTSNPLIAGYDTTFFEISTNGGSTWITLDFLSAPAPQTSWSQVIRDLSPYAGSNVYFRFRDWSDGSFNAYGSGVDSIRIEPLPVGPPDPAGLVSPVNAGTDIAITATLNWSAPTTGGTVTGYKLFFGTDNPPTNIVNGTNLGNVLTYDPTPDMSYSTPYYWQIVPTGSGGDATGCPIWSFTTLANPTVTVFPYAEGFEAVTFPPVGWSSEILNGTYNWERVTAGIYPVQLPYSGVGEARFESYNAPAGSNARLVTPPLVVPTAGLQVRFQMFHYPFYGALDSVTLDVTTNAGTNWTSLATFLRENAVQSWREHLVPLTGYTGTIQVGFHAWSDYGSDMFIDSVRVEEVPPPPSNYPPTITYTPLSSTTTPGAFTLTATITDDFGVDSTVAGGPRLWYRSGATIPLGGSYTPITGTRTAPGANTWTFPLPSLSSMTFVEYYVAAQDSNLAVTTNPAGRDSTSNPPNATVTAPNRFVVSTPLTFTVGTAGANFPSISEGLTWFFGGIDGPLQFLLNSDYTSAGEVFPIVIGGIPGLGTFADAAARGQAAVTDRSSVVSKQVTARGMASSELGEALFGNEIAKLKSNMRDRAMKAGRIRGLGTVNSRSLVTNTFTIKPNVAATPGPIVGNDGGVGGLVILSAANYVTIEGLTIQNTGTGGVANAAFWFTDGSSFNRIVNCTLQAGHIHPNIGVVWTTDNVIPSGCNNNVIDNCDITSYLGVRPTAGVTFYSAPPVVDMDDTLRNSRVFDYGNANATYGGGAYGFWSVESTDRLVIENNSFYMTSPAASTGAAATYAGILIGSSATGPITNTIIRNNTIHDINATGTPALIAGISAGSGANVNGVLAEGNNVHDLGATTTVGASGTRGAYVAAGLNQTFTRNTFKDLQTLTPGGVVIGLRLSGAAGGQAFKTEWTNNMIVLGNVGTNDNVVYRGINDNGGTDDTMIVAFNSVYIGGVSPHLPVLRTRMCGRHQARQHCATTFSITSASVRGLTMRSAARRQAEERSTPTTTSCLPMVQQVFLVHGQVSIILPLRIGRLHREAMRTASMPTRCLSIRWWLRISTSPILPRRPAMLGHLSQV